MSKTKTQKTTIGIVLSTVPRYSETFFRNKIKGLQSNGFEVVLFVDYRTDDDQDFPCKVVVAPKFDGHILKVLWISLFTFLKCLTVYPIQTIQHVKADRTDGIRLRSRLKRLILNQFLFSKQLDWLHFGFGMLAEGRENVASAIDAKMAVSFRGFDLYLSPLKHKNCYDLLFRKNAQYHVLSQEMKQDLMAYHIEAQNIRVITPAINTDFFYSEKQSHSNEVTQIVTVARLHWKKGIVYTLEAMQLLKQKGIHFHYTIIGDGEELERLQFAVHQLDLNTQVTFAGKLPQIEVKKRLEASHLYVQYSIQEGFCNAVLEAQAMGLMTIVSNAEGLSENVLHEKSGWVVPKRQPKQLAQRIIDVINLSSKDQEHIRTFAVARVRNEFNLMKQNQAFVHFYNN
ncbi:colanic acid/amylovoran biosynthesis glycosyltransferase [Formosa sp. Hel1_31_208]|uniref:glycosyltransferase n=1 Tax=Formosa sp. Hel1_31_208 TaxID=1798225 RepID=UPI00087DC57B|nr:glycosyltransferase [Formosa sp. Hel1_31_208]SDS68654.1 colanic acid/amylovoran biosynthesis glycosyltransferase [Formosa sp. Hel1_31_208]